MTVKQLSVLYILLSAVLLAACAPSTTPLVPTDPPTTTATFTPSPTYTPGPDSSPTPRPTLVAADATGGPSPTPLFGATRTAVPDDFPTATRAFNPNAPRIEFFTSDPATIAPGGTVTLYWSTRGVDSAVIYRLDAEGVRAQVYNVVADGNLPVDTRRSERGALRFVLAIGEGGDYTEEVVTIPLECPFPWFFSPSPEDCAIDGAVETRIVDMTLQRGRMLYIEATDTIYVLFNDGVEDRPSWLSYENRFDPEIHPAREESAPPEWIQPLDELGFVWRGDDEVRNRLGLGMSEQIEYEGFTQTSPATNSREVLYISGADGVVLQILPGNEIWQIIGGPR